MTREQRSWAMLSRTGPLGGGNPKSSWRAGWAAVMTDDFGNLIYRILGPCPDDFPTSLRSEQWGVLMLLERAIPPIKIHVDNATVVKGTMMGKTWCIDSGRKATDLWKFVWERLDALGPGVIFEKCKGHATDADVEAGRSTKCSNIGNDHADTFANKRR